MLKVGLTGGIGSGKSTVAKIFEILGVPMFQADASAKELMSRDPAIRAALVERFGGEIFDKNELDRTKLASIIFHDPAARADVNAIVHPAVRKAFEGWCATVNARYVIMEAALLAETGGHAAFDRIVVVTAPEAMRVKRVMDRDGAGEELVLARVHAQGSDEERLHIADHVLVNDGSKLLVPQVLAVNDELIKASGA